MMPLDFAAIFHMQGVGGKKVQELLCWHAT